MRFLPTRVHGVIDYAWGLALIATAFALGMEGAARWTAIVFGAGAILYSLVTDYEVGALRIVPMPVHLVLDGVAGSVLAVSPWLFGFAREVWAPHLAFGLFSVVASLVTRTRATQPV